jgi:hypothetical protein
MEQVEQRLAAGRIADPYDVTCRALPDARIVVAPTIAAHSMHSTPNASAIMIGREGWGPRLSTMV